VITSLAARKVSPSSVVTDTPAPSPRHAVTAEPKSKFSAKLLGRSQMGQHAPLDFEIAGRRFEDAHRAFCHTEAAKTALGFFARQQINDEVVQPSRFQDATNDNSVWRPHLEQANWCSKSTADSCSNSRHSS
jgi:hypothetical protein